MIGLKAVSQKSREEESVSPSKKLRATFYPNDGGTPCTVRFDLRPSSSELAAAAGIQVRKGHDIDDPDHVANCTHCGPMSAILDAHYFERKRTPSPKKPTLPKQGA